MIKYTNADKTLVVPSGLGNFGQSSGSGGGVTPQQAAEIASAVTEAAIDEYDTELQVELEEIRDAVSGSAKDFIVDWAYLRSMDLQGRREYFDVMQEAFDNGYNIYAVGKTSEGGYDVKMPLIEYRRKEGNVAGWARFAGFSTKDITGVTSGYNIIYSSYNSNGYTYPDNPYLDRELSFDTTAYLNLSEVAAMTIEERIALFDDVFQRVSNGEKACVIGLVQEETIRTAVLPLVSYRPETNPALHQGGYLYFAAKGDTDNVYFHVALSSEGSIDPTSGNIIKRNIYNLPTASAEVKGGVRIGSGLTMTQDTLSLDTTGIVTDGDLAPFIVQQSANTENIASLSAATEAISESLGNYATTADTNELATAISGVSESLANYATTATTDALSAVTSALTESVAGKQDTLSAGNGIDLSGNTISVKIGEGLAFSGDTLVVSGGTGGGPAVYVLNLMTQEERAALYTELSAYRYNYASVSSSFPVWNYSFYYWAGDVNTDPFNDRFSGFVPMELAMLHPDDYGGACFFTGTVKTRAGDTNMIWARYVITSDGSVDSGSGLIEQ